MHNSIPLALKPIGLILDLLLLKHNKGQNYQQQRINHKHKHAHTEGQAVIQGRIIYIKLLIGIAPEAG